MQTNMVSTSYSQGTTGSWDKLHKPHAKSHYRQPAAAHWIRLSWPPVHRFHAVPAVIHHCQQGKEGADNDVPQAVTDKRAADISAVFVCRRLCTSRFSHCV